MSETKEITDGARVSKATLGRLPLYLNYLCTLPRDEQFISAPIMARELKLGEVQVRKDLAAVCGFGRPKVGYSVIELREQLEYYLGHSHLKRAILVGAGKLGRALLDYTGFADYGLEISAAFDSNPDNLEPSPSGKSVYTMRELPFYCGMWDISLGIITVPRSAAQEVADLLVELQIKAIWSFAPIKLVVPDGVIVKHEDLALSLAYLEKKSNL